jgi:hypothetical protein
MDVEMTIQTALKKSYRLKFALVTETFKPEINGVAMKLRKIREHLTNNQHQSVKQDKSQPFKYRLILD